MPLLAVFTTVSNEAQAEELAMGAVEHRLAACVQIEPIKSTYRWKGHIERDDEIRLMFKTTTDRHEALMQWLAGIHPYALMKCQPSLLCLFNRPARPMSIGSVHPCEPESALVMKYRQGIMVS